MRVQSLSEQSKQSSRRTLAHHEVFRFQWHWLNAPPYVAATLLRDISQTTLFSPKGHACVDLEARSATQRSHLRRHTSSSTSKLRSINWIHSATLRARRTDVVLSHDSGLMLPPEATFVLPRSCLRCHIRSKLCLVLHKKRMLSRGVFSTYRVAQSGS